MTGHRSSLPVNERDIWVEIRRAVAGPPRPALFVDRDGTLIEEIDFLHDPEHVHLVPGTSRALAAAHAAGWLTVMVTNQSGIGRGIFQWADFAAVQQAFVDKVAAEGAAIDAVVACAHHPEGTGRFAHPAHESRKPAPGMMLIASEHLPIDLTRSVIVGDRCTDIAAGRSAGLRAGFIVRTGYGAAQSEAALKLGTAAFLVRSLPSIAAWRPGLVDDDS